MENGFITLDRKLLEWEWHDEPLTGWLWINLLLMANFREQKWHGEKVARGQLVTSRDQLAFQTGLTDRQLRTRLERLQNCGCIEVQATNRYTVITICKYDSYQTLSAESDRQPTNERPTSDQQPTTNNKGNNNNKPPTPKGVSPLKPVSVSCELAEEYKPYAAAIQKWLIYKHERRETYKSNTSLKVCFNKLIKLSGNSPDVAMQIVEQSMANNWAGLFALKDDNNGTRYQDYKSDSARQTRLAGYAAVMQDIIQNGVGD